VLKFRSNKIIVIAPAKTGKDRRSRKAVKSTDQEKRELNRRLNPQILIFKIVLIKFAAPKIEEAPAT